MLQLVHHGLECSGCWLRMERDGRVVQWRCSACGACYADDTAVRFAVLREYDLELILSRLMREGRLLLRRTGTPRALGRPRAGEGEAGAS